MYSVYIDMLTDAWDVPRGVSYAPGLEQEYGLLPSPFFEIRTTNNIATGGFERNLKPQQRLEGSVTRSRTETFWARL